MKDDKKEMLEWVKNVKRLHSSGYLYLGSPYHHQTDTELIRMRAAQAAMAAGILQANGLCILSPIAHGHALVSQYQAIAKHTSIDFWRKLDKALLTPAAALIVLTLPLWQQSRGLAFEIDLADELEIPRYYLTYEEVLTLAYTEE